MESYFWLTFVASILGLIYAFSKGESDGLDVAKVILASIIMIVLVVVWINTGEDPLEPKKQDRLPDRGLNHPNDPIIRPIWQPEPIEIGPKNNRDKNPFEKKYPQ